MQVFKMLGDRFSWTIVDSLAKNGDICVSYCNGADISHYFRKAYYVDRDVFSEEELIAALQHWAAVEMKDTIIIYTEKTIEENQKLIDLLKQLHEIPKATLNGHEFCFIRCVIFCKEPE